MASRLKNNAQQTLAPVSWGVTAEGFEPDSRFLKNAKSGRINVPVTLSDETSRAGNWVGIQHLSKYALNSQMTTNVL